VALTLLRAHAPAIARCLERHPDVAEAVATGELPDREAMIAAARAAATSEDVGRELRRLKYRVVGGLVLRDLAGGPAVVDEVTAAITDLADALVEGALLAADERLSARHGRPTTWPDGGGFVAFAMGKHGGGELNYSSDIDLIWVVADQNGSTDGAKPIASATYAARMGAEAVKLLADRTADGFCFRVDLMLRPDGRAGPATASLASAEHYYLTWGRTWERAAWLKARPCAGDLALGEELLRRIEPFRFRRSMDFGTLQDLGAMRDRIADAARDLRNDLKKGPGGIREIEFLIQATQLIWAGRDPSLRVRGTLDALRRLVDRGALPADLDADALADAYRFLRCIEHRLQWPDEAQTQRLPPEDDEAAWQRLAAASGLDVGALHRELSRHRGVVEAAWGGLLQGADRLSTSFPALVDPFADADDRRRDLRRLGFDDLDEAERRLAALARASARDRMRPEAWRRFERVAPRLLQLAAGSSDPDRALQRLESFVARVGARGTTYMLLHENPSVMETLVRLFASSAFLSELLVAHPELLDALVLRGRGGERDLRTADLLWEELRPQLEARPEGDDAMLALRTFHTTELLRVGLADLGDALPGGVAGPPLTAIAVACVRGAHRLAHREMLPRHGDLPGAEGGTRPTAVLAFGSLGSGWMSYGSDLDLSFLYADGPDTPSTGSRPLDPRRWAARWSQRVVTALTAQTREGRCYEVDLRLRPDGNRGALVVPRSGFEAYYRDRAHPWERIALCRARVVSCSDPGFADDLDDALADARTLGPASGAAIVAEARRMRERQRTELAREIEGRMHLKTGRGGLTEVEFAVACTQVTRPPGHPATRIANPLEALQVLTETGDIAAARAEELAAAYRFMRQVESRLRLRSGRGDDVLDGRTPDAGQVAASLGLESADALLQRLRELRAAVEGHSATMHSDLERAAP